MPGGDGWVGLEVTSNQFVGKLWSRVLLDTVKALSVLLVVKRNSRCQRVVAKFNDLESHRSDLCAAPSQMSPMLRLHLHHGDVQAARRVGYYLSKLLVAWLGGSLAVVPVLERRSATLMLTGRWTKCRGVRRWVASSLLKVE